jgi:uncharacterized protein (DUF1015 family)
MFGNTFLVAPEQRRRWKPMITIGPVPRALIPVDSTAATQVSAPNYDEFQSDREIWEFLKAKPDCVLGITMSHCDVGSSAAIGEGDSEAALLKARVNLAKLVESPLTCEVRNILWVYEIVSPARPAIRQIGLGGMARTGEIRGPNAPHGSIVRNEGVREPKARGRADLIKACNAIIGTVNNAVEDVSGRIQDALERYADIHAPTFQVEDLRRNVHRIWIVGESEEITQFQELFAEEPHAYVADGNHRSRAAEILGYETFLAVFFTAGTMGISPYHRLVKEVGLEIPDLCAAVGNAFEIVESDSAVVQPTVTNNVGLYSAEHGWMSLKPRLGTFDPNNAVDAIDAEIVQRNLFGGVFGIPEAHDDRLIFVGGDRDAAWLQAEVDNGRAMYAVTLAAVTMDQFIEVCRQNRFMPPKSTWFEPKICSGLVMALLG